MWTANKAIHIGTDHQFSMRNRQDYCNFFEDDKYIIGVVCDGCSEGKHSEVGAALVGNFILDELKYFKLKHFSKEGMLELITPKPLRPTAVEVGENPRARSARLRVAERIK